MSTEKEISPTKELSVEENRKASVNKDEDVETKINNGKESDESNEDDDPDCSEIQKILESETTTRELLAYYEKELFLVDETPETREELEKHPERSIWTMRNTASSSMMHGLIAGWIKEIKQLRMKEPDVVFRKHFSLTFAVFRDDHWIGDSDVPDTVYFLVKEIGILWKNILNKNNEVLKITHVLRTELKSILKYYSEEVKRLSDSWDHPIEFIYCSTKYKYPVTPFHLDEIEELGIEIQKQRVELQATWDKEFEKEEEEANQRQKEYKKKQEEYKNLRHKKTMKPLL